MKMSFPVDGTARSARAPIDYPMLVAGIAAQQTASRTAAVAARLAPPRSAGMTPILALAALVLGDRDWAAAAAALGGSFHPGMAGRLGGKTGSTNMKPAFTFAF